MSLSVAGAKRVFSAETVRCLVGAGVLLTASADASRSGEAEINLASALRLTLEHNTELAAYPFARRREEALQLQAGIRPAPTAQLMLENAFGSGAFNGLDATENTLTLNQLVELGEKRQRRVAWRATRVQHLAWEYELARLDVLAETARRFYAVLELQESEGLTRRQAGDVKADLELVRRRIAAGGAARADGSRMRLRLAQLDALRAQLVDAQDLARMRLAAMWQAAPEFARVVGNPGILPITPESASLKALIASAPAISAQIAGLRVADARLALEAARGRKDLSLGVSLRHLNATDDLALVFSIDSPISFANPNRGRIAAAQAQHSLAAEEVRWSRQRLELAVRVLLRRIDASKRRVAAISGDLMPLAQRHRDDVRRGYERGLYSTLEWTEARQEVFLLGREQLAAQMQALSWRLELDRLMGIGFTVDADGG